MDLLAKLSDDFKKAMLSGDQLAKDTIRSIKGAIKYAEIEKGEVLQDEEISQIVQKAAKQRKESITQYEEANRDDLALKEKNELAIIEQYLPDQLSDEELEKIISDAINESGASSMADIGKVMSRIMPLVKGRADGSFINQKVKLLLSEQ